MTQYTEKQNAIGVGMAIAAGIIVSSWGDDVQAEEILGAACLTTVKALREAGVDWYDIRLLVPVLRTFRDRERSRQARGRSLPAAEASAS
jgi:hypothetical protein